MNAATCFVFFCSGAAALLFETLWFREAGLVLGNTVWASALVTAAFMAGLAIGNAFAIRAGWRLPRPLRTFAYLELGVASTGFLIVAALPGLSGVLAPVLALLHGPALDAARVLITFALLIVPASAMGATLPVLARSLGARDSNFGRLLGRLYGWNTLGAVAGALVGEWFLIRELGVLGTGLAAAGLDLTAAVGAWILDRGQDPLPEGRADQEGAASVRSTRLGAAAFVAGWLLLALEVVWFRFLLMFTWATTGTFAILLAVVLAGIGGGGLLASHWLGRRPRDGRHQGLLALAAGLAALAGYSGLSLALPAANPSLLDPGQILRAAAFLMLPACTFSGALFTFLGHALREEERESSRAAGLLTLANTIGAMLGSLLAGFVLLPMVGVEASICGLACGYAAVFALASTPGSRSLLKGALILAAVLLLFPFGAMRGRYVAYVEASWREGGYQLDTVKEGLTETVFLLRQDALGQPRSWRLLTNGMGMSTTDYRARRYMGLFVWLPVALHPEPRSALVISYGLGNTARTLTATAELTRIDVVDVSADVLSMAKRVWPEAGANPLRDPRVHVTIEDGRFFLLTSREGYDIITGEPPPPKSAGIGALYSREYFALMRDRLREGGIATYWLPVLGLDPPETLAVTRGFCDVFDDCSLWTGYGHEWLLVGTRGARGPVSAERFTRQWNEPIVSARLKAAGFSSPARLGAAFMADADQLKVMTRGVLPLSDDHPYRLDPRHVVSRPSREYALMMDPSRARERFRESALIKRLWPPEWIEPSMEAFTAQAALNRHFWSTEHVVPRNDVMELDAALAGGDETLALWTLGTSVEEVELAARAKASGVKSPEMLEIDGAALLARQRFTEAEALLAQAEPLAGDGARLRRWRILAAELQGDHPRALQLLASAAPYIQAAGAEDRGAWDWLAQRVNAGRPPA